MTTRTDIHRPSAPEFDPEAYELVDVFDLFPEMPGEQKLHNQAVNELVDQGYRFTSAHEGARCGHCGTRIRYAALMTHPTTKGMLHIGETCLANRFVDMTRDRFQELRARAALNRERIRKADRIAALCDEHPALALLTYPEGLDNDFLVDVALRFRQYGELSERQIQAAELALVREVEWANRRPAPEGKQRVTGKVVMVKAHETAYGVTMKMIVRTDEQWSVWTTIPSALMTQIGSWDSQLLVGRRVAFTATLTRSDRDECFAFAKRPTKVELIAQGGRAT